MKLISIDIQCLEKTTQPKRIFKLLIEDKTDHEISVCYWKFESKIEAENFELGLGFKKLAILELEED